MYNDVEEAYVDYVYGVLLLDTMELDSVYKDYILRAVGTYGFNALYKAGLLEGCGSINGRKLFVLVPRKRGADQDVK